MTSKYFFKLLFICFASLILETLSHATLGWRAWEVFDAERLRMHGGLLCLR